MKSVISYLLFVIRYLLFVIRYRISLLVFAWLLFTIGFFAFRETAVQVADVSVQQCHCFGNLFSTELIIFLIDESFIYRGYQIINKFMQGTAADSAELQIFSVMKSPESLRNVLGRRSGCSFHIIDNRKFFLFRITFNKINNKNPDFPTGLPTL